MSSLSLLIGPVVILAAASLLSWYVPFIPALEPNVHVSDTYFVFRGWVAGLTFPLTVFAGIVAMAARHHAWSVWVTRAGVALAAVTGLEILLVVALQSFYSAQRMVPPVALADGIPPLVIAAIQSLPFAFSVAVLVTLLALIETVKRALKAGRAMPSSERRHVSVVTFAFGAVLCVAWGYWSIGPLLASRPSNVEFGEGSATYALASILVAIAPMVMTFGLVREVPSRVTSFWRWCYAAAVVALTAAWMAGGIFTPVALLGNPVHTFFATGALAIWIAQCDQRA